MQAYKAHDHTCVLIARYHLNTNILLGAVRGRLKWADVSIVKAELDAQVSVFLGPKLETDNVKPDKKKKKVRSLCPF